MVAWEVAEERQTAFLHGTFLLQDIWGGAFMAFSSFEIADIQMLLVLEDGR